MIQTVAEGLENHIAMCVELRRTFNRLSVKNGSHSFLAWGTHDYEWSREADAKIAGARQALGLTPAEITEAENEISRRLAETNSATT